MDQPENSKSRNRLEDCVQGTWVGFQTTVTQEEWGIGRSWRVPLEPPLRAEPCVKLILAVMILGLLLVVVSDTSSR